MTQLAGKIYEALSSRLARNIFFWMLFASSRLLIPWYEQIFAAALIVITMVQVYVNNLVLVPHFLAVHRRTTYIVTVLLFTLLTAAAYLSTVRAMLHFYPHASEAHVSIIVSSRMGTGAPALWIFFNQLAAYYSYLITMTIFFTMAWYVMDYGRQQKRLETATKKELETALLFLRGQVNPHFLLNTLNNLYTLTVVKDDRAPEAMMKLSAILRYLLYEADTKTVSFTTEKEAMQAYIDLELLRLSDKDGLSFTIEADAEYRLPALLWLPVLENVFKHGTRFIAEKYDIDFQFRIRNGQLTISSCNTFKNVAAPMEKGAGIGLANLRQRLAILYPGRHDMKTSATTGIFNIDITISL